MLKKKKKKKEQETWKNFMYAPEKKRVKWLESFEHVLDVMAYYKDLLSELLYA